VIVNVSEAERALGDIKSSRFAGATKNDIILKIRLNSFTADRLRKHVARQFDDWDYTMATWLVVEGQ
jgi:hypothetical protein